MAEPGAAATRSEMNGRERVTTSLDHREPDRVPLDIGATNASGIHLRAYRELVGVGRAYALLIGPNSHLKLGLLSEQVALLDESLWNAAGSSGTRYLYAEIKQIWPGFEEPMS